MTISKKYVQDARDIWYSRSAGPLLNGESIVLIEGANRSRIVNGVLTCIPLLYFLLAGDAVAKEQKPETPATHRIGTVQELDGTAYFLRADKLVPCQIGDQVLESDGIRTGKASSVGVVLNDETIVSMGPNSELTMDDFVFEPTDGICALAISMLKGTFVYVSGHIAKFAPESVHIQTPVGAITVRGTKLLIKVEEETSGEGRQPHATEK